MMNLSKRHFSQKHQGGFALITSLMFLVILTVLAVSAMGINSNEEKMLGFSRDRQIALQAAEAALRDAERYLLTGNVSGATGFSSDCASGAGLYQVRTSGLPIWSMLENDVSCKDDAWTGKASAANAANGKSFKYGTLTNAGEFKLDNTRPVSSQPRFIIEVITMTSTGTGSRKVGFGAGTTKYVYRVTAVGFGLRQSTRVLLQAIYRM